MLSDVLRNVPTEVDVLNQTIVHMAKSIGSSAPLNKSMVRRVNRLLQKRDFSSAVIIDNVQDMKNTRLKGTVGFVPTMGGLQQGHLDLVRAAAAENDAVVVR
jgi:hypothetical protein